MIIYDHDRLVWFVLVWFGLVCVGLVWFGLVCVCLVWFGLVWFVLVPLVSNKCLASWSSSQLPPDKHAQV